MMTKRAMRRITPGIVSLLGVPAYLLLDEVRWLPPSLRDRPWPIELPVMVACLAAVGLAFVTRGRDRRLALGSAVVALLSTAALFAVGRVLRHRLPPSPPELAVGQVAPPFSLPDESGRVVELASLRGHATLLFFYRGAW